MQLDSVKYGESGNEANHTHTHTQEQPAHEASSGGGGGGLDGMAGALAKALAARQQVIQGSGECVCVCVCDTGRVQRIFQHYAIKLCSLKFQVMLMIFNDYAHQKGNTVHIYNVLSETS